MIAIWGRALAESSAHRTIRQQFDAALQQTPWAKLPRGLNRLGLLVIRIRIPRSGRPPPIRSGWTSPSSHPPRLLHFQDKYPQLPILIASPAALPHLALMSTAPAHAVFAEEVPSSFFEELSPQQALPAPPALANVKMRALALYDAIIDDILANPGTKIKETSVRLGKTPATIGPIMRSDTFRLRWAQRRKIFNEDQAARINGKMGAVLEQSLDNTLEALKKKGDSVPLPILRDINDSLFDALGYAPSRQNGPSVVVQQNMAPVQAASADALAAARNYMKVLGEMNASSSPARPGNASLFGGSEVGPVVEGEIVKEPGGAS